MSNPESVDPYKSVIRSLYNSEFLQSQKPIRKFVYSFKLVISRYSSKYQLALPNFLIDFDIILKSLFTL